MLGKIQANRKKDTLAGVCTMSNPKFLHNQRKVIHFLKWPQLKRPAPTEALCVLLLYNLICRQANGQSLLSLPWAKEVGGQHEHRVDAPIMFAQVRQPWAKNFVAPMQDQTTDLQFTRLTSLYH